MNIDILPEKRVNTNCLTAIGYVEILLCILVDGKKESSWESLVRNVNGIKPTPNQVISDIRKLLTVQLRMNHYQCELPKDVIKSILMQISSPKFYTYIKGKIGVK